ncbi:aldo/keto reductase [Oceaniglobus roseus]|uniref:aldo/keto reductase n=1 Tax=Oceaniglobus roseus TaxID=1737570 RepID=UPI000C7EADA4|nr:aldo/keto reductase [Kandeliimicrobium roseum]
MRRRRLGASGQEVSCVGVGALSFSDFYGATSEENSRAVLVAAMEAGVDFIDTSNIYGMGRSERAVGAFLRDVPEAREAMKIATKAGITTDAGGRRCFDNAPEHLEGELDGSLQRLGVDCVDLFYVHRREAARPIEEVTETLARLVAKGKIRAFGFSEIAPSSLARAAAVHPVAAVQSEYSLATRAPDLGLRQACAAADTALVAFSPVGRSFLTDRPLPESAVPELAFLKVNPRFQPPHYAENIRRTDGFRALAAEMGVPAAGLAVAWCLAQGGHVIPIPGTRSGAHLRGLLAGAEIALGAGDLARIEAVLPVGWTSGDRYSEAQWMGVERYC